MRLLTTGSAKLEKGSKFGWFNAALYLSPADLSGTNFCSHSTQGCRTACLNTAGRGGVAKGGRLTYSDLMDGRSNRIQKARLRRSDFFLLDRKGFCETLFKDFESLKAKADGLKLKPALRLNGTSDLDWFGIFSNVGLNLHAELHSLDIEHYEYTKVPNRWRGFGPTRWTFSLSEHPKSEEWAEGYLKNGHNVAVVARQKTAFFPIMGRDYPTIDGDEHDLRFADPWGVVVLLKPKGWAKHDTTGFVK